MERQSPFRGCAPSRGRVSDRDCEWSFRQFDACQVAEPACQSVGFGQRDSARVPGDTPERNGKLARPRAQIRGARQPRQPGLLEVAPQLRVELFGNPALTNPGIEGSPADVVDQLPQLGMLVIGGVAGERTARKRHHRNPIPRATTPRNTSLVPPRKVNNGL